jgi:twitching motility two-component system response regulator PilH
VLQAANGEEGLRIAETREPECILLDFTMPDMSGLQVLQLLRDRHVDTPAVVFSADTEDTTKQQCLERGAAAFVIKSPDGNELLGVIAEILRSKNGGKRQNDA